MVPWDKKIKIYQYSSTNTNDKPKLYGNIAHTFLLFIYFALFKLAENYLIQTYN